ncbi:MAG: hypothetical protein ACYSR5_12100 [Planctomycetota bacterium]|jgi:hypothetical protein
MFWDLFDKIINAVKPGNQSQQPPEQSEQSQSWSEGQSRQDDASQEPSPDWQETTATYRDEQQP